MDMQNPREEPPILRIEGWDSVENWLSRMGETTAGNHRINFDVWVAWMRENGGAFRGMTPDELVRYQKEATNSERYDILDVAQRYINSIEGKRINTKKRYYSMIRSFFAHNRAELPKDPTFIIRSSVEKVRGTLTVEDIRDVVLSSKPLYRAIFISIFQGGMGLEEFKYWNTHGMASLMNQLRGDPEVVRVDLPGRKKRKNADPYHTFIGGDAIKAIRDYLRIRPEGGEGIFLNQFKGPVSPKAASVYWTRHLVKLGFIIPTPEKGGSARYGKNMHELRDVFRSQWEKSPAKASVAEYLMGHIVDPLEYNKAHRDEAWTRDEYLNALPMLQIMSNDTPFGKVSGKTVDKLQETIDELKAQIAEMMPAFKFAQEMFEEKRERDRIRESSKEPPIPIDQEGEC